MKAELKQEWLDALRSGEYTQGRSILRSSDNHYCCLGVLCDLVVKRGQGEWVSDGKRYIFRIPGKPHHDGWLSTTSIPNHVRPNIGLEVYDVTQLMLMNDNQGASFEAIANYIEGNIRVTLTGPGVPHINVDECGA